jgi:hypothetical protein
MNFHVFITGDGPPQWSPLFAPPGSAWSRSAETRRRRSRRPRDVGTSRQPTAGSVQLAAFIHQGVIMTVRMISISMLLAAVAAVAGCASPSQPATGAAKSPSSPPAAAAAPATPAAQPSTPGTAPSSAAESQPSSQPAAASGVAIYRPSTVVSQTGQHTLLHTPDSVAKVSAFYERDLAAAGWHTVSHNAVAASTNLIVRKGSAGASISITKAGPAMTTISITTYG